MKFRTAKYLLLSSLLAIVFSTISSGLLYADNFYVSPTGDDANVGTAAEPFRTVSQGALALAPGDCLFVFPGVYRDEGTIFVRFVGPAPNFEFMPIVGSPSAITRIIGISQGGRKPIIFGNLDIRGSFIRVVNLTIRGDQERLDAGIGVFESHNVTIKDCRIFNHGGGGISFNQCDIVFALDNWVGFNAFANPNQSSGISLFQSVVRTDSNRYYGAVISGNTSVGNENRVPPTEGGAITDGNGIIVDDFRYTQDFGLLEQAMLGEVDPGLATGVPVIDFDGNGMPLSYPRRTLIQGNTMLFNGGRGIHCFLSDNVHIFSNLSYFNLNSADLTDGLPRDQDTGNPFFVNGEINLADSKDALVIGNFGVTDQADAAGAAELFFTRDTGSQSSNLFRNNRFRNIANAARDVDVFGVESSTLSSQGR